MPPAEYGFVSIAFILPNVLGLFQTWGTRPALTRFIAQARTQEPRRQIRPLISSGLALELTTASLFSVLSYLSADWVSQYIFDLPQISPLIKIASLSLLATAMTTTSQVIFNGFEKMEYTSLTNVMSSTLKAVISPILIILGLGAQGPVIGQTAGYFVAGILGLALVYLLYRRTKAPSEPSPSRPLSHLSRMMRFGFPLTIAGILTGLFSQFHYFLLTLFTTPAQVGNYSAALGLTTIVSLLSYPIATALFPAFSKIDADTQRTELQAAFRSSVHYMSLGVVPASLVIMVLSQPLVEVLYTGRYDTAPLMLSLSVSVFLLAGVGRLVIGSVMKGTGETRAALTTTAISSITSGVLGLIFTPYFGATGLILAIIAGSTGGVIYGLIYLNSKLSLTLDYGLSAKVYTASALAGAGTILLTTIVELGSLLTLVAGGIAFLVAYLIFLPITGGITRRDLENIRRIIAELRLISWIILPILTLEGFIMRQFER